MSKETSYFNSTFGSQRKIVNCTAMLPKRFSSVPEPGSAKPSSSASIISAADASAALLTSTRSSSEKGHKYLTHSRKG